MPIYKVRGYWYARIEKGRKKWTPKLVGMTPARWKRKNEAKLGEAELRQRVEQLRSTQTGLDLLTLCNKYLDDAQVSYVGHDTFALKKRLCKELLKFCGNIPCEKITVHMAHSYLLGRAERVSNNSFNVYRQEGSKLFEWGKKQELLPRHLRNPFAEIQKKHHEKNRRGLPQIEHVVKVYKVATPEQKDLLKCYFITGARKSEILKWEWSDIDFKSRTYALHTWKSGTGKPKTTYHEMPDRLYRLLERRFEKRHPRLPYVFWHRYWDRKSKNWREDRYQSLNKFTKRLCKKAGVPPFNLHQLRRLDSTILKERGNMGLAQLQRFLRHDKQKTTEIYAGHLETGTKEQTDFLADFWENTLDGKGETSSKSSSEQNKKG